MQFLNDIKQTRKLEKFEKVFASTSYTDIYRLYISSSRESL